MFIVMLDHILLEPALDIRVQESVVGQVGSQVE
jgi:hypothetical protein